MKQRSLGTSGLAVSVVGLGCNNFGRLLDARQAKTVVDAALDAGITFFDTADTYGGGDSEVLLGMALKGRRDRAVVATKFGHWKMAEDQRPGGSRQSMRDRVHASLERLGMQHVDLLYYHWPDGVTPISETLGYMAELVEEGKARAIGCSNFTAEQLREGDDAARVAGQSRLSAIQNEYSLIKREADTTVLPLCRERDIGFVPYFPLASGLLTGKYKRGEPAPRGTRLSVWDAPIPDQHWDVVERAQAFAEARGHTLLELAVSALLTQPGVSSVIAGATGREQVRKNAAAAGWQLSAHEHRELDARLASARDSVR
jgi:aryl-alcohol dehydrogenase-like predicted oxidoreductase